jgi:GcrA cell cycle regulator
VKFWTDERVAELRRHVSDGLTIRQSAKIFDCSKNTVVGKASRLGLRFDGAPGPHRGPAASIARTPRLPKPPKPVPAAAMSWGVGKVSHVPVEPTQPVHPMAQFDQAIILPHQLEAHHCKWPSGEPGTDGFGFCGATRDGDSSYCPHHRSRSTSGVTPKYRTANDLARSLRRFA